MAAYIHSYWSSPQLSKDTHFNLYKVLLYRSPPQKKLIAYQKSFFVRADSSAAERNIYICR